MPHLYHSQGDQQKDLKARKIYYTSNSSILAANVDLLFYTKYD
jgi:hypothetical protein